MARHRKFSGAAFQCFHAARRSAGLPVPRPDALVGIPLRHHRRDARTFARARRAAPTPAERDLSSKNQRENLVAQLEILLALREKLATSPETRRNLAAFHRGAWNNLSGLREDLFQQSLMRLAATSSVEEAMDAGEETLHSRDAHQTPPHLRALLDGADPADLAGYAAALQRALQDAEELRRENERLVRVAEAARDSGWIRFGAWLGERSARRMMEMKEEVADLPPGREISIPHRHEGPPRQEPDKT